MIKELVFAFDFVFRDFFIWIGLLIGGTSGCLLGIMVKKVEAIHKHIIKALFISSGICELICFLGTPRIYSNTGYDIWGGVAYNIELLILPAAIMCFIIFLINKKSKSI